MARLLALLLILVGFNVAAAPAHADVAVSIRAGRVVLMSGESTTISGKAIGAHLGSVVNLQRKISGRWVTLRSKKVWSTRTYAFMVSPPKGYQYFRVVKPRQFGQARAASAVLKLTVRWKPTLRASAEYFNSPSAGQTIRVIGSISNAPAAPVVVFQRKSPDGWMTLESREVDPGSTFTFEEHHEPGPEYRVRLVPTTLTSEQLSAVFVHTYAPYVMQLNSGLLLTNLAPTSGIAASIEFDAEAGDYVTLDASAQGVQFLGTVTSPSGQLVATVQKPANLDRFIAPQTGTYEIDISQLADDVPLQLWLSTPKVITTAVDAPGIKVDSDFPGQVVDVRFDTTGTSLFTVAGWASTTTTLSVLDSAGVVVQPFLPEVHRYREAVYREAGGMHTFRMVEPTGSIREAPVRVLSVTQLEATVNGPNIDAVVDVPHRVVLIGFERPAEHVTVGYSYAELTDVGVFDAVTGQASPTGPGRSVVAVAGYDDRLPTVPIQLTTPLHRDITVDGAPAEFALTNSYLREVALHFHATKGQHLSLARADEGGLWGYSVMTSAAGVVPNFWGERGLWTVPADGEYTITVYAVFDLVGSIGVETVDSLTIPGDGTPVTVDIDEPGELIVATIPMPFGTTVDATLDNVSSSLEDTWYVGLYPPDNSWWYNSWAKPGLLPPFTIREPENITAVITAERVGSLRLSFAPRT